MLRRNLLTTLTSRSTINRVSSVRFCSSTSSSFQSNVAAIFTVQGQQSIKARKQERLQELEKKLSFKEKELDEEASKKPDMVARFTLLYLTAQSVVLYYWVYSRFDWCLCEPITYLLGTAVTWMALGYYIFTGTDYDWDNLRSRWMRKEQEQIYYAKFNVNVDEVEELKKEIALLEEEIEGASSLVASSHQTKKKQ